MVKNEYAHFNPKKYDLHVKISTVRTGSHSKHNINYHIIWIPKYRKKLLVGRVAEILKEIIAGQCSDLKLELLALEVMPDHIHLFVGATPMHIPAEIVKQIKGNTSIQLRRIFKELMYLGYQKRTKPFKHLWAKGYYIGSAGHVSQDVVKRYIMEQQGKDVFEYHIFGGAEKIGDFSQTNLRKWSK